MNERREKKEKTNDKEKNEMFSRLSKINIDQ